MAKTMACPRYVNTFGVNMAKMVALRQMYMPGIGTVQPGDVFDIDSRFVRALKGTGRARDATVSEDVSLMPAYRQHAMQQTETVRPEPAPPISSEHSDEVATSEDQAEDPDRRRAHLIAHLRTRARALGIQIDGRWSEDRLKREIAEVTSGNRYERRDLRVEDQ